MSPEQAWREAAAKGGVVVEFDSEDALRSFRLKMYKVRAALREELFKEFQEVIMAPGSVSSYEDSTPKEVPSLLTGFEGLITVMRGPKSLWIGPDEDSTAHGIVGVKAVHKGDVDG